MKIYADREKLSINHRCKPPLSPVNGGGVNTDFCSTKVLSCGAGQVPGRVVANRVMSTEFSTPAAKVSGPLSVLSSACHFKAALYRAR